MNKIIIDTSSWIEYFNGTEKGARVKEQIDSNQPLITGMIATEILSKFIREQKPVEPALTAIRSIARMVPITFEVAHSAAQIYHEQRRQKPKFGIVDAQVAAAVKIHGAKVVTCDYDFSGLKDVILIK